MSNKLASRLDVVVPSATLAINAKAQAMKAQGLDVISFGAGEPDFDTPVYIRDAAHKALESGKTRYTAVAGIPELRKAIAEASTLERGVVAKPENVVVSVGAKSALFNFALAVLEPGDEMVIPSPHWVSYPEQARLAGATPVFVPSTLESGWKMSPDDLARALGPKTKAVMLCSPCNPTGAAYTADALEAFAKVLRTHDCWIVCDEIYSKLVYDGFAQRSLLSVAPDLAPGEYDFVSEVTDAAGDTVARATVTWKLGPVPA
ncbi:MAG: aminotransferase class I/II-fold pyridoxal phosphate-dependent enzyme [Deltaproteobacteria bacterium]